MGRKKRKERGKSGVFLETLALERSGKLGGGFTWVGKEKAFRVTRWGEKEATIRGRDAASMEISIQIKRGTLIDLATTLRMTKG